MTTCSMCVCALGMYDSFPRHAVAVSGLLGSSGTASVSCGMYPIGRQSRRQAHFLFRTLGLLILISTPSYLYSVTEYSTHGQHDTHKSSVSADGHFFRMRTMDLPEHGLVCVGMCLLGPAACGFRARHPVGSAIDSVTGRMRAVVVI